MSCIEQLEKAEEQEKLLEESKVKLEKRRQKEDEMRKQLQKTEVDVHTHTYSHTRTHIVVTYTMIIAIHNTGRTCFTGREVCQSSGGSYRKNKEAEGSVETVSSIKR